MGYLMPRALFKPWVIEDWNGVVISSHGTRHAADARLRVLDAVEGRSAGTVKYVPGLAPEIRPRGRPRKTVTR